MSTVEEKKVKILEKKREMIFRKLQTIYDLSTKVSSTPAKLKDFIMRARTLENLRTEFVSVIDELNTQKLCINDNYEPNYKPVEAFDEMYFVAFDLFKTEEMKTQAGMTVKGMENLSALPQNPGGKLLPLNLPKFNGATENWPLFFELFTKLVHENKQYTDIERVSHLVAHLEGSARSVCLSIPPTAENYSLILQTLKDRFEDRRALASAYVENILKFKPLQTESEKCLDNFLCEFVEPINALKLMQIPDLADYMFLHLGLKKLDAATAKMFENSVRSNKELPKFSELVQFVSEQAKILSRSDGSKKSAANFTNSYTVKQPRSHNSFLAQEPQQSSAKRPFITPSGRVGRDFCALCNKESHALYFCPEFRRMKVEDRWSYVKKGHCYNCLSSVHLSNSCKSTNSCRIDGCSHRHHSLLHRKPSPSKSDAGSAPRSSLPSSVDSGIPTQTYCSTNNPLSGEPSTVLLASVVVLARDADGRLQEIRGILDAGSQAHFITQRACKRLGLPQESINTVVKGIGTSPLNVSSCATLRFHSRLDPTHSYMAHALVVSRLSDRVPAAPVDVSHLQFLKHTQLSDVRFHEPHEVDLLIGADLWPLIVRPHKIVGPVNGPFALQTTLGDVVMGRAVVGKQFPAAEMGCMFHQVPESVCLFAQPTLDDVIRKFWELEEVPKRHLKSTEDDNCDRFFMESYVRNSDGTFTVRLPFRKSPELLGSSKDACIARLVALERRLSKNPVIHELYTGLIQEYISDGTVSRIGTSNDIGDDNAYFMPHHGVYRAHHPTTPLRIVYNASAPTSSSFSLNSLLYVGPKLQADIFNVLIHFRLFQFVATSDVKRMFLRINIAEKDRRFQRFVWRDNPEQPIDVFQVNKVVFGNTSSPYLANKVVRLLAELEGSRYPLASVVAKRDVYVDDVVTSTDSEDELIELYHQLTAMFASGGFSITKWVSNSKKLLEVIPEETVLPVVDFDHDSTSKVLGVCWSPQRDVFTCIVDPIDSSCTKRNVASTAAHIFDPLGLVAPVTLTAKLFIKSMWERELAWDDKPSQPMIDDWENFKKMLPLLKDVSVPRHTGVIMGAHTGLVGFSDSSEKAYGACVYIRTCMQGQKPIVRLLCAKAKVAPKKVVTIPRLELCAALMLSQLMRYIIESFESRLLFNSVIAFTDSRVTLHWIQSDASRWKIFVGNRIAQLQENLPPQHWRHVPGEENPADVLSRGTTPEALLSHPLWFTGPAWLMEGEDCWPRSHIGDRLNIPEDEAKPSKSSFMAVPVEENLLFPLLDRISSFRKLLRATAYIFRVVTRKNLKTAWVTREELRKSLEFWIRSIQSQHYHSEINKLNKGQALTGPICHLDPFVHAGILRVGGRLINAPLSFDQKHPVLLPSRGRFVDLLIDQYHVDLLHGGQHLLLAQLRLKYWIPAARTRIRTRIHRCNVCFRARPKPTVPKMGPLPEFRVNGSRVFERTGIDYAGPFTVTPLRRRGQRTLTKAYLCIFICLAVKAVHIELASDLSSDCFLAAYKRFLSRRGPCSLLISDGGTNFIGARRKLNELEELLQSDSFQSQIGGELAFRGVEWKINPAYGPWFGGVWESNIKCIKGHLRRFIGEQVLTYEELNTALIQIEAVMNSRPLCVLSSDPNSPTALTPAHFLNPGATLDQLPARDLRDVPLNRLARFELTDRIVQDYWERWRKEYLQTLHARSKWTKESTPIKVGTVVVIIQDNIPPLRWPLGVIEQVFPGVDGNVRVVAVRTTSGTYRRPVGRVCPLPTQ